VLLLDSLEAMIEFCSDMVCSINATAHTMYDAVCMQDEQQVAFKIIAENLAWIGTGQQGITWAV